MTTNTLRTLNLAEEARLAIRAIRHTGSRDDVSSALAAIMKCSTEYGWTADACRNLIYKAWSKQENACATVRRRRKRIQQGLMTLVEGMFALEDSISDIAFPVDAPAAPAPEDRVTH